VIFLGKRFLECALVDKADPSSRSSSDDKPFAFFDDQPFLALQFFRNAPWLSLQELISEH
jgi:hypothetical protein